MLAKHNSPLQHVNNLGWLTVYLRVAGDTAGLMQLLITAIKE